ncbi:3-methyladenine DNA glycosylase [Petrocella atlantisensis]|uniref:3-methyladenine DNA glycosylase n=1 Tax=Petrocella atlantisensis TaxID=2173034 RepID=A0A3P7PDQ0_9FIRM|nr:DNA alkylation repair protein [Petrocella atlantisensis]VDN47038.1 3-methyladenine DNA glycosylase [Petrocella atlantisensis]
MENDNDRSISKYYGTNLAEFLADRIIDVYKEFPKKEYIQAISRKCEGLSYSKRVELHADELYRYLPEAFDEAAKILVAILGEENKNETGMFKEFYWILPLGKYVEKYGLDYFDTSMYMIEEITKRNTGEYAVRPFIRLYPEQAIEKMTKWADSDNFHLRRLSSEGLRPKLPWATKLDTFIDHPEPVFKILEKLKEDDVMFVKKSVANHLTDWLKVNKTPTIALIEEWNHSNNKNTKWIIKRATRKISIFKDADYNEVIDGGDL